MTSPYNPLNLDDDTRRWLLGIKDTGHGLIAAYKADDWDKLGHLLDKLHQGNAQEVTMVILNELIPGHGVK